MTNPASLVFPEINESRPFERISGTERDKLEIFLRRGQSAWLIPTYQRMPGGISVMSAAVCLGLLGWHFGLKLRAKRAGQQTTNEPHEQA